MPDLSAPRLSAASCTLAFGHRVQLVHVITSFTALPLLGHRMGTAPEITLPFNVCFHLPHCIVGCLKDKGRGNETLTIYTELKLAVREMHARHPKSLLPDIA